MKETLKPKKYKLTIHSGENEGDKGDVVLVHNFNQVLVQRDVEVEIDACFVDESLAHSKIETVIKDQDGKEKKVHIPRFSYSHAPA